MLEWLSLAPAVQHYMWDACTLGAKPGSNQKYRLNKVKQAGKLWQAVGAAAALLLPGHLPASSQPQTRPSPHITLLVPCSLADGGHHKPSVHTALPDPPARQPPGSAPEAEDRWQPTEPGLDAGADAAEAIPGLSVKREEGGDRQV